MRNRKVRAVLRHPWTLALIVLAGLFSAAEALLPYCTEYVPNAVLGPALGAVSGFAFILRIFAQREINGD